MKACRRGAHPCVQCKKIILYQVWSPFPAPLLPTSLFPISVCIRDTHIIVCCLSVWLCRPRRVPALLCFFLDNQTLGKILRVDAKFRLKVQNCATNGWTSLRKTRGKPAWPGSAWRFVGPPVGSIKVTPPPPPPTSSAKPINRCSGRDGGCRGYLRPLQSNVRNVDVAGDLCVSLCKDPTDNCLLPL